VWLPVKPVETGSSGPIFIWLFCAQDELKGECMFRNHTLLIALAGSLMIAGISATSARAEVAPRRIEITAKRFTFQPGDITLRKGQPVVIVLKSIDVAHGLRFRDLNVAVKVGAGGTAEVQFTPEKTGDFVGHCYVFCGSGHGSMAMTLHVVD
jgi:cytochrome c oxidase subunit 2